MPANCFSTTSQMIEQHLRRSFDRPVSRRKLPVLPDGGSAFGEQSGAIRHSLARYWYNPGHNHPSRDVGRHLTGPSLKLAENCGSGSAIVANPASALRSDGNIFA